MKTGQTVDQLGLYTAECCDEELIFDVGDILSRCPSCEHLCEWEFEYELMTPEDLERINGIAA